MPWRACGNAADLVADATIELVVVASPNYPHPVHTIAALQAGKAVVCEKPVAPRLSDLDSMIAAAERTGGLFTIFQNRRYDPGFRKIKEVIASGKLGRIVEVKISAHGFGRRWDWQTLREGAALPVTPACARRVMSVIDRVLAAWPGPSA